MDIYLGAQPGTLFLTDKVQSITFSTSTARLLSHALDNLIGASPCATFQLDNLRLFRDGEHLAIADTDAVIFISSDRALNLISDLPRFITLATTLSCALPVPPVDRPARRGDKAGRRGASRLN